MLSYAWTLSKGGHGAFPKDLKNAAYWFRRAAELGQGQAQLEYGKMLEDGIEMERDVLQAVAWYQKALEGTFKNDSGHEREELELRLGGIRGRLESPPPPTKVNK